MQQLRTNSLGFVTELEKIKIINLDSTPTKLHDWAIIKLPQSRIIDYVRDHTEDRWWTIILLARQWLFSP